MINIIEQQILELKIIDFSEIICKESGLNLVSRCTLRMYLCHVHRLLHLTRRRAHEFGVAVFA